MTGIAGSAGGDGRGAGGGGVGGDAAGIRAGAGVRAGTIGLLGPTPPPVLSSFRFDRTTQHEKLVLVLRELCAKGLRIDESLLPAEVDVYIGDLVADGTGEIYQRHMTTS